MNKRHITIFAVSAVCLVTGYLFFSKPSVAVQEQKILHFIESGNAVSADAILHKVNAKKLPFPQTYYKGLIAQLRGKFAESHLLYQMAIKNPKEDKDALLVDIYLAEMSNAFLEHKDKEFAYYLDHLQKSAPLHPFIPFFEGLSFYQQGKYGDAVSLWKTFSSEASGGKWTSSLFAHLFPEHMRQIYLAHALIETGDVLKGREILEKESRLSKNEHVHELATLFLGLSYLKESQTALLDQRSSYYQLSCFYFEKSRQKFTQERKILSGHIQREVEFLVTHAQNDAQKKLALDFLQVLQDWKEETALNQLCKTLIVQILENKDYALCRLVAEEFKDSPFYHLITQKLVNHLSVKLKGSQNLFETWETVEILASISEEIAQKIANLMREDIFDVISQDDKTLTITRQHVNFWGQFNTHSHDRHLFGLDLLKLSKLLWQTEGQEDKGLCLMDVAIELDLGLKNDIELFLTNLYFDAENSNLIRRLSFIYEALEYFGCSRKELATPCKIANYLADAEYLYHARNFFSAKVQAGWVLKMDPLNQEALRLAGLSAFHLGEYAQAFYALRQISEPDEYACRALILSQVYSSDNGEKHLVQIDNSHAFDHDVP